MDLEFNCDCGKVRGHAHAVQYANRVTGSIFVSLHFNNGPRSARGIETYALPPQGAESTLDGPAKTDHIRLRGNDQDADNIALATAIHASMMHELKAIDRGIRRVREFILRRLGRAEEDPVR